MQMRWSPVLAPMLANLCPCNATPRTWSVHQPQRIYIFFASLFDTGTDGMVL
jgi:hypothetical protein